MEEQPGQVADVATGDRGERKELRSEGAVLGCEGLLSSAWGLGTSLQNGPCKVPEVVGALRPLGQINLVTYHLADPSLGKVAEMASLYCPVFKPPGSFPFSIPFV